MLQPPDFQELTCAQCRDNKTLGFDFTMAFQPIVDIRKKHVFAYEALIRGLNNESAYSVISKVNNQNRYRFDQACRVKAIALASQLQMKEVLSINFLPNAVYRPELCLRTTLEAAVAYDFPVEKILFELTEVEKVQDTQHLCYIVEYYQQRGFKTAMDDFGAGYSGLNLLSEFQPDIIKLDMQLIRDIDQSPVKQAIVRRTRQLCDDLGILCLGEGVETYEEMSVLAELGVTLLQGYYFARPGFETLPSVDPASYPDNIIS